MLNLIDNKRLLHSYQLYSNRHCDTLFSFRVDRSQYAHPIYCEWCKRIWIFRRSCGVCKQIIYCCGKHENMKWCKECLFNSNLKKQNKEVEHTQK